MQNQNVKKAKRVGALKKKSKRNNDGINAVPNALLILPKTVTQIMPDRIFTKLTYNGAAAFTISTGTSAIAKRWTPSAAYDIDPALGSTTTVGFTELSAFYNNYRVIASKMTLKGANQTSTPLIMVLVPLNADPGSSPSTVVINSWINNPYQKHGLLPASGGPVVSFSEKMSTEKIYGSKMIYYDDNFAALVNAIPVNNWYWAVGLIALANVAANTTATIELDIEIDVEFYSRKALLN